MRIITVLAVSLLLSAAAARAQPPDAAPSPGEARQAVDQANAQTMNHGADLPAMIGAGADAPSPQEPLYETVTLGNGVSGTPGEERFEGGLKDIVKRADDEATAHIAMQPRN